MSQPARETPEYLLLGEVLRPHGVRGELRLRILTDHPERINDLERVYVGRDPSKPGAQPYSVEHMRMNVEYGLLKLKGIEDRNEADRRGAVDGLRETGDAEGASVAELMLRALEPPAGS